MVEEGNIVRDLLHNRTETTVEECLFGLIHSLIRQFDSNLTDEQSQHPAQNS